MAKLIVLSLLTLISSVMLVPLDSNKTRVLLIGIDGLLKTCLDKAEHYMFDSFKQEGSWTLNARTAIETMSAPGWSNILCGMETEDTGIVDNDWLAPWMFGKPAKIDLIDGDQPLPCVFGQLKKNDPNLQIKITYTWSWFLNLGNISIPGTVDKEDFCDQDIDGTLQTSIHCDEVTVKNGVRDMQEDFDFLFVYFGSLDETGHDSGFCNDNYIDRLSSINKGIETLITELKTLGIYNNTYIITTTDHGATYQKTWHGNQNDSNLIIPYYIVGPNIKKGYELKELVKNDDTSPTILHIFGYQPNEIWRSRVIFEAFINQQSPSDHGLQFLVDQ